MSGFEVASFVLGVIPILTAAYRGALRANLLGPARAYRKRRFGLLPSILLDLILFDSDSLTELHRNINVWGPEDLKAWKDSYVAGCNAIAVAASPLSFTSSCKLEKLTENREQSLQALV